MATANTHSEPRPAYSDLHARIGRIGERLSVSFRDVIEAVPGGPHRPQELSRVLGVSKDLSSRTLKASSKKDPLAVAYLMPGPASLQQLLRAAARRSVSPEIIREADSAVREFERLIRVDAGDRISLDGIISAWLPDARERFETGNKQAVFRGMAQLKGVMADVAVTTAIIHPSGDGKTLDGVWVLGSLGLRRIRPGPPIHFWSGQIGPTARGKPRLTLDGTPAEDLDGLILEQFCSDPVPRMKVRQLGTTLCYMLDSEQIGPASAADLYVAEVTPHCMPMYATEGGPRRCGPSSEISTPIKTLVFDVLLHEDAFPGLEPTLLVYDTALGGVVDMNDPAREVDRLDVTESVEFLGWDTASFRASEVPHYSEIISLVCEKRGWDHRKFRGYRCRAQYPIYGSQFSMSFIPPPAPGE
jgi:hypothetical protein